MRWWSFEEVCIINVRDLLKYASLCLLLLLASLLCLGLSSTRVAYLSRPQVFYCSIDFESNCQGLEIHLSMTRSFISTEAGYFRLQGWSGFVWLHWLVIVPKPLSTIAEKQKLGTQRPRTFPFNKSDIMIHISFGWL